ncbi:related to endo-beta-1,4-glucanase [Cephalotrichum gorgonifer]|uniref:Related to endo-beta-1,4-glucanase n=1 Tax=Cephalotrichum gorgonifer TaxID=2041049 RepID=A0AAE8SRB8_9PEZI|nr:related to endo-beta-1,4-glucanase [Cephalotrichum gorgonifer]
MFILLTLLTLVLAAGLGYHIYLKEKALSVPWTPDASAIAFSKSPLPEPDPSTFIPSYALPLRTRGRDVVDATGRRFKLSSVNWYGGSDVLFVPSGLDIRHRSEIARTIRRLGFNSVRLPYSDEMVIEDPPVDPALLAANPDLVGSTALDVFEAVVRALTAEGVAVIVNNHITTASWCCGTNPCDAGWSNDHLGGLCRVPQTEADWIDHWVSLMSRLADDPYVIGADLRNEVRGVWGTMPWSRWAPAAERCGARLQALNPDWLIIVGGTESGNDLSGVARRPVVLPLPDRVVYSSHVYAWSGWGDRGGRYSQRPYASFEASMKEKWGYLLDGDVAPVWVGEFGSPTKPSRGDANYWRNLMRYLIKVDADFGYWAINPRKPGTDEIETYKLVEDDWETPVLDYRMKDMIELMAGPASREEKDLKHKN